MHRLLLILFIIIGMNAGAQELNCRVEINVEQTGAGNLQVFKTLQKAVQEFMSNTTWTQADYKQQERIDCSLVIIVSNLDSDFFSASIQVQSSRPTFNSTYNTTVFNFNDKDFSFRYTEFQPMAFNPNTFDSNLISTLAFYAYTIIGMDAATFSRDGGTPYFETAKQIVNTAQQEGSGWSSQSNRQNRYKLNDDLLSPSFSDFNEVMYAYHRNGLDFMAEDPKEAKQSIAVSLELFDQLYASRPNNFLTRVFFDAKAEEVAQVFSGGPQVNITSIVSTLNKVAPTKSSFWQQIKF